MGTTKVDIEKWLSKGNKEKHSHLIVVCDTFNYEDYPVLIDRRNDITKEILIIENKNMSKIMEIYNYDLPIGNQLKENRAYNV